MTTHPKKKKPGAVRGRPSLFSHATADKICSRMARGESLNQITKSNPAFPTESTVRLWALEDREGFAAKYARARELQAEHWSDQILEIADAADFQTVNEARLQVDSRKWLLSKLLPKKYGDLVRHAGADGESNPQLVVVIERHTDEKPVNHPSAKLLELKRTGSDDT